MTGCCCVSEKLYNSQGPELRRSLFSLKQLFQVKPPQWNQLVHCSPTGETAGSGSGSGSCRASRVSPVLLCLQDDKDLVPEFVASEGLTCFIRVGAEADHNYQNYILRGEAPPSLRLRPP